VDLAHLPEPRWLGTRYWLAVRLDAGGRLRDVAIRTDRDATWHQEGDDDDADDLLAGRLSEAGWPAATWIVEEFGREE
jgi:hypothetical protein